MTENSDVGKYIPKQTAFVVDASDNVAVALEEIEAGLVTLRGEAPAGTALIAREPVGRGFKLALQKIPAGGKVIKHGIQIAVAVKPIRAGECVHLHNVKSMNDLRAQNYDRQTAEPHDRHYSLPDRGIC
ncbi:UxaA family hydrolase [Anaerotruncus rubiinfantis]|uniref:UxaA family hydrolase n=1 Tax=Anaerotruncus rubiinfantis TaxID=1720200 RepID=UPI00082D395F|nr:UxaA family hydrolase [Anaerotruncus rubiinfantis]